VIYLRGRTLAPAAKFFIETLRFIEQDAERTERAGVAAPRSRRKGKGARR